MPVLHFDNAEFSMRRDRVKKAMSERALDGLIMFAPESHYWLTGYDTFGFAMFQAMVLTGDGKICLLTRAPDLRQAQQTSLLGAGEIRIWVDREGGGVLRHRTR
jgi:Xaa-Pro dipeptidase